MLSKKYNVRIRQIVFPIGPSIAYIPITKGLFACISTLDAHRCGLYNWHALTASKQYGYIYARRWESHGKGQLLHEFILGKKDGWTIDHKSGEKLDCRRDNLRYADYSQQQWNQTIRKNNTSGYKGVYLCRKKKGNQWKSVIVIGGKNMHLGYFSTAHEAHLAYRKEAEKHHGDFANFL